MNYREALSEAVQGSRVRAVDMPEGVYIDYAFAGWRINFPGGNSSGWHSTPHDETVDWEDVPIGHEDAYKDRLAAHEAAKSSKWGKPIYPEFDAAKHVGPIAFDLGERPALYVQQFGRALRQVPAPPVVVKDWALDPAKTALAVPPPTAADPWGRPGNVGSIEPTAPKRDSWGRLIDGE